MVGKKNKVLLLTLVLPLLIVCPRAQASTNPDQSKLVQDITGIFAQLNLYIMTDHQIPKKLTMDYLKNLSSTEDRIATNILTLSSDFKKILDKYWTTLPKEDTPDFPNRNTFLNLYNSSNSFALDLKKSTGIILKLEKPCLKETSVTNYGRCIEKNPNADEIIKSTDSEMKVSARKLQVPIATFNAWVDKYATK
jgi:hypothetical protein